MIKRTKIFFLLIVFITAPSLFAQKKLSPANNAFTYNEKLKYRVYYHSLLTGNVTAGIATMEIDKHPVQIQGRNTYHITAIGQSKGVFNWFYKVNDRFETFIDEDSLVPLSFIRRTKEGGYIVNDDVVFDRVHNTATSRQETKEIYPRTQDIISAFYYARTFDFSNIKAGEMFPVDFYLDDSVYTSVIKYLGKETIEIDLGKFRCMKFKPMVVTGEAFDEPYPMTMWISDDENKVPLLIESEVIIGSVRMELLKLSGLRNPMKAKVK